MLFYQLFGVEIAAEYGGAHSSFMVCNLVIEELAKVDPAIAVCVDIQNTLNNALIMRHGTQEQKDKYLPRLATDTVSTRNSGRNSKRCFWSVGETVKDAFDQWGKQ